MTSIFFCPLHVLALGMEKAHGGALLIILILAIFTNFFPIIFPFELFWNAFFFKCLIFHAINRIYEVINKWANYFFFHAFSTSIISLVFSSYSASLNAVRISFVFRFT